MVGVPHSGAFQTPEVLRTCSDEDVMQMKFRRAYLDSEIAQVATGAHVLKGLEIHELLNSTRLQRDATNYTGQMKSRDHGQP